MIDIQSFADLELLRESVDVECKLAAGRDGQGALPVDLSKTLQHLTQTGMLESTGGRGAIYHLPGEPILTPDDVFGSPARISGASAPNVGTSSLHLPPSFLHLEANPTSFLRGEASSSDRDADGRLVSSQLVLPVIDDLALLSTGLRHRLETIASLPRQKRKVGRETLIGVLMKVCEGQFVTLRCMAELVNRQPVALQSQYLSKLVRERKLSLAFPTTPTHERQAYCSISSLPP